MRVIKHSLPLGLILIITALSASTAFGQVKYVDLAAGKKLVLKGRTRPGAVPFYVFNARPGQLLSVHLLSPDRNVRFGVDVVYNIEGSVITSDAIVEGKRDWTGKLPESDSDQFGVGVTTRTARAGYTLEITLAN
jgi:hypothetical protein